MKENPQEISIRPFDSANLPGLEEPVQFFLPELPLTVEIGCGVGMHPIRFATENPDRYVIAIEHTRNKFLTFRNSLRNLESPLENLLPIHANAITWISKFLPEHSVDHYFLLYPNPWPKEKQKNQRWHQMPFMQQILYTLKPNGTITLATNLRFYAEEAVEFMTNYWKMSLLECQEIGADQVFEGFQPRTHFELKYLQRGETCHHMVFKKS